jgi:tRNA (mo5U34)-methyltransferase
VTLQSDGQAVNARDEVGREIRRLAPWFHNLHLPGGRQTAPDHPLGDFPAFKWEQIGAALPDDLSGARALDIGCNAGFYSFALAARGAEVVAIDVDEHYLRQAAWARELLGLTESQVSLRRMQVYELARLEEEFDVVLFLGVLYHLRYPMLALDIVAQKVRDLLVLQSLTMPGEAVVDPPEDLPIDARDAMLEEGWPAMAFIERRLAGDETNWWAPNRACVEAMLRTAGLQPVARPGHEIHLARRVRPIAAQGELRAIFAPAPRGGARSP